MTTLTKASRQWATRPDDQRFPTIQALFDAAKTRALRSAEREYKLGDLRVEPCGDDLLVASPKGAAAPTHWAFGQMCTRVGAPAGYLRKLPATLAAECLNTGLQDPTRRGDEINALVAANGHGPELHAMTSGKYARIWNWEIAGALLALQERQPWWTFPTAFKRAGGAAVDRAWGESREMPVAFASDHDMFVFLCDYEHGISVPGQDTPLARGFWIENSEVGAGAVHVTTFLFDFVCCNLLVWGAEDVREIKIRHVGNARHRALETGDMARALKAFAEQSAHRDEERIARAQKLLIADTREDVISRLFATRSLGLAKETIEDAVIVSEETPRYGDPRSVWAVANGLTEVSQRRGYADERAQIDRAAGKVLAFAA